ncbi:MAG: response regulator [candidate division Zixibacteria bacterium]|nr:response regulator [candidate division Zixibacteria bacterium]
MGVNNIIAPPICEETLIAKAQKAIANGRRTVLVVDDEPSITKLLTDFLEAEWFTVIAAASAEEALDIMKRERIHVIVSDIILPKMWGTELLAKIKSDYPDVPVILITGFAGEYTPEKAVSAGADGYFAKPFRNTELVYTLRQVLRVDSLWHSYSQRMQDCR